VHAIVLAGGKGTRLRPLTDTRPKPLVPFAGAPLAAGLLRRLEAAGCDRATFLVGAQAKPFAPLERLGSAMGMPVNVVSEPQPLDTAGACRDLLRAGEPESEPALVCNGDILTDLDYAAVVARHTEVGATATLVLTRVADTSSFGVVECDRHGRVRRFIEKPPAGTVAADTINAGTYVLAPDAFEAFPSHGPLSFERAVFPGLLDAGARLEGYQSDSYWIDLGTPQRYLQGHRAVLTGRCAWPVDDAYVAVGDGVLLHVDAAISTDAAVGPDVVVGPDSRVEAGAQVAGSVLFEAVVVGAGARVRSSVLAEGSRIRAGATVSDTVVAAGATVS
jgi:NDP-sugar pyrophosphorylase family protein